MYTWAWKSQVKNTGKSLNVTPSRFDLVISEVQPLAELKRISIISMAYVIVAQILTPISMVEKFGKHECPTYENF